MSFRFGEAVYFTERELRKIVRETMSSSLDLAYRAKSRMSKALVPEIGCFNTAL
jgi:hypothetical protein